VNAVLKFRCFMSMYLRFAVRVKPTAACGNIRIYSYNFIFTCWFCCNSDGTEGLYFIKCGEFVDCLRNLGFQKGLDSRELLR
jgi:hypothetical protein